VWGRKTKVEVLKDPSIRTEEAINGGQVVRHRRNTPVYKEKVQWLLTEASAKVKTITRE